MLFIVLLQREDVYKIVQQFILLQVFTIFCKNTNTEEEKTIVACNEIHKTCKVQCFKIQRFLKLSFEWPSIMQILIFIWAMYYNDVILASNFHLKLWCIRLFIFQRKLCPYNSIWCHNNGLLLTSSIIIAFGRIKRLVKIQKA